MALLNARVYDPTWFDRIVLFRSKILQAFRIDKGAVIFICKSRINCIYLKFSYPGNVQYHRVNHDDLEVFIENMRSAKNLLDDMENSEPASKVHTA